MSLGHGAIHRRATVHRVTDHLALQHTGPLHDHAARQSGPSRADRSPIADHYCSDDPPPRGLSVLVYSVPGAGGSAVPHHWQRGLPTGTTASHFGQRTRFSGGSTPPSISAASRMMSLGRSSLLRAKRGERLPPRRTPLESSVIT